jgi:hypothetical protein
MLERVLPRHVVEIIDETERRAAETRFLLKLAALYASPGASVSTLAESCGYHPKSFAAFQNISPELALKLEGVLGRELFPREFFRPDLFCIPE